MKLNRRHLLAAGSLLAGQNLMPIAAQAKDLRKGTHLVLLGTMAGPVLHTGRAMASQVLFVDGRGYLVDCGYGTMERMTAMGIRPQEMAGVYITHHHSDHNADYASLVNMAWILGLRNPMKVFGPPPMQRIHEAALALQREDIDIRIRATGRDPIEKSFSVTEIAAPGPLHEDDRVKVRTVKVDHAPFALALGYRFDTAQTSVVFSGDTAPSDGLVELARGAHTLVHEAMYVPGIDAMLAKRQFVPPFLRNFLLNGHTSAEDAGRIAARAGVKRLVLTHLLPGDEPIAEDTWRAEAAKHFAGDIVVARDKMTLSLT
jgi:ribonuclease BN (tRNA processing enzyme)